MREVLALHIAIPFRGFRGFALKVCLEQGEGVEIVSCRKLSEPGRRTLKVRVRYIVTEFGGELIY